MMIKNSSFCRIDRLPAGTDFSSDVAILRLDLLHPVVSGNKWFKLKNYLAEARKAQQVILTSGGAFSNHVVATAAAAKSQGLKSIGLIRGERPQILSHTLQAALAFGMDLHFLSRIEYKNKAFPAATMHRYQSGELYLVPEGGYGSKGVEGAKEILASSETADYTHIVTAVGTGTTLAGLTLAASEGQQPVGISIMKNNDSLQDEIGKLLPAEKKEKFLLVHDYHFGGYAKKDPALIRFMNDFFRTTGIPTDFVYTAKAFYGVFDLLKNGFFPQGSKILVVHTGGLQGNESLPNGTLIFR